jgi:hypothetical protein
MRFSTACTCGFTLSLVVLALAYTIHMAGLSPADPSRRGADLSDLIARPASADLTVVEADAH